jgi:hypothetical protein
MDEDNKFEELFKLNVNDNVDKKGQFKYLSWAWAWAEFLKIYPSATYEIVKNDNGLPYFSDNSVGGMVYTKVKAGGVTHEMWLPIMDFKNQAKKTFDMMDVNKAVMRCLVKNLAMFGLGLYIYAGEDLPESEEEQKEEPKPTQQQKAPPPSKAEDDIKKQLWNSFKARCGTIDPMLILERDGINMGDKNKVYATVRQYMNLNNDMFKGVLDNF